MKFSIGILQMAGRLADHASARQTVIANNLANADTPGFKARDIASFADTYTASDRMFAPRPPRPGHIPFNDTGGYESFESSAFGAEDPNGNTVSLEDQMVRSADIRMEHDLALGIYGKSLDILRAGMGRIR